MTDSGQYIIGGYTSYYRSQVEPCCVNAKKADRDNMRILEFSNLEIFMFALKDKFCIKK